MVTQRRESMRWKTLLTGILLFAAVAGLLCLPASTYAQNYRFSLDREVVDVWINTDGSAMLEYWLTFTCDISASPIDVVDLGLPNSNYNISDISADVDGVPVANIDSDYQGSGGYGVAIWLGSGTIQPGRTGTVHVVVNRVGRMLYEDTDEDAYASIEFSPVWFDSQFTYGSTDMTVRFHMPPGVDSEEPRWHSSPSRWPEDRPAAEIDSQGRVVYIWSNPSAEPDREYIFGASFPLEDVDEGAVQAGPTALEGLFGIGASLFSCICNPVVPFFIFVAGIIGVSIYSDRRRRMKYLPPSMKVEGVGIKRGLTAVEAAIVLETPLNKVMTMVLFGLLRKGAVTVLDENPLRVMVNQSLPENLRPYEEKFLEAVKDNGELSEAELRKMMVSLVKAVNKKMKGFSRKETVAYYQDILRRAWQQVESADTPEVRSQRFNEGLEVLLLDRDFDDRAQRVFHTGPYYLPPWWIYHRPWSRAVGVGPSKGAAPVMGAPGSIGTPSLPALPGGEFAANIVRGIENTASGIVGSVTGFTSKVTSVTNPPPKSSSRSSGSRSSGGSCACACACACAGCACACAGGGR
jgi:hypothetical protein